MNVTTTVLAAEGGGFHAPTLDELFQWPAYFLEGTPFAFNRVALLMFVSVAILSALMVAAFREPQVVPGKLQASMEGVVAFVRDYIVIEVVGPAGLRFVPLLTSLFMFIFISNFFEVTPLIHFPTTSRIALPAFLAFVVWALFVGVGMREQGVLGYLKSVAIPPGVPWWVLWLVIPIELISTFLVRPFTLAIRLFANLMAGHILLAVVFIAGSAFLVDVHTWPPTLNLKGSVIGIPIAFVAGPLAVAFEAMVAALQAYIFTILAAVYLGGSLHPEH